MTTKEVVLKLIQSLPDDASIEDIQYHLYVLQKIQAGEEDVETGRVVPHEEVMRDLSRWLK